MKIKISNLIPHQNRTSITNSMSSDFFRKPIPSPPHVARFDLLVRPNCLSVNTFQESYHPPKSAQTGSDTVYCLLKRSSQSPSCSSAPAIFTNTSSNNNNPEQKQQQRQLRKGLSSTQLSNILGPPPRLVGLFVCCV